MNISGSAFDYLLNHMLDIHNRKINIVRPYSNDYDRYTAMLEFLNKYIRTIGDFLDTAVVDDNGSDVPFVIMGSVVSTEGIDIADRAKYCFVLPDEIQNQDDVTIKAYDCLTPVSDALLFKGIGEKAAIKENGRLYQCTIKRIDYP